MISGGLLCLVTDRHRLGPDAPENRLIELIERAARAGVDLVQIREPDLDARALIALVATAVDLTASTATRIVVNDRLDVALAAGAAGVHLKHSSCPPNRVRELCPSGWLVGRSVHTLSEAVQVSESGGVDYLIMGTIFQSISKPASVPAGICALADVARQVQPPVLAIGGVSVDRAGLVGSSGAGGIAAVGEFLPGGSETGPGLDLIVSRFREAFDRGRASLI